jgi:DNA polymerase III epsilon subunit-like protein
MREIVVDTETTDLNPLDGHRLVEIWPVELINRCPTGNTFHRSLHVQGRLILAGAHVEQQIDRLPLGRHISWHTEW